MGWYTDFTVNISVAPDYKYNLEDLLKSLKNEKNAEASFEVTGCHFDTWCGCGNMKISIREDKIQLTTTLKRGWSKDLEALIAYCKYTIGEKNIISIDGTYVGEDAYAEAQLSQC